MKKKSIIICLFLSILFFYSCAQPETPVITGTGPDPASEGINVSIINANSTIPDKCIIYTEKNAGFSISILNNGRAIADSTNPVSSEVVILGIIASSSIYTTYEQIYDAYESAVLFDPDNPQTAECFCIKSLFITAGLAKDSQEELSVNSIIIPTNTAGNFYYYAILLVSDMKNPPLADEDQTDNIFFLNETAPFEVIDAVHTGWGEAVELAGGSRDAPVSVPALEAWYRHETTSFEWFEVTTIPGRTYDIYMDNIHEGSGTYTGSEAVIFYDQSRNPLGLNTFFAYYHPLAVVAAETSLLLVFSGSGSYAFGIHERILE